MKDKLGKMYNLECTMYQLNKKIPIGRPRNGGVLNQ